MLMTRPPPRSQARTKASTTSSTNTKSRVCRPSPCTSGRGVRVDRGQEGRHDAAVGSLPRAVHRREGQDRELDRRPVAVDLEQIDRRTGHDAVHASRDQGPFLHRDRLRRGMPVEHRGGNGCHHLRHTVVPARFEDRRDHAERRTAPVRCPGRDAAAAASSTITSGRRMPITVSTSALPASRWWIFSPPRGAGFGEVGEAPGGEVVDDVDLLAFGEEAIDQVGTDEPGSPDHHYSHRSRTGISSAASDQPHRISPSDQGRVGGHGIVDETSTVVHATIHADHAADDRGVRADDAHHERRSTQRSGFDRRPGKDHRVDDPGVRRRCGRRRPRCCCGPAPRRSTCGRVVDRRALVETANTAQAGRGWPPGTAPDDRHRSSSRPWRRRRGAPPATIFGNTSRSIDDRTPGASGSAPTVRARRCPH